MSKRKRYSPEYKHELVELVRRSKSSCRQIALEVGVNPALLTRWVREADAGGSKAFPGGGTHYKLDIGAEGRSQRYLYYSSGLLTLLAKDVQPVYEVADPVAFNRLIGAAE